MESRIIEMAALSPTGSKALFEKSENANLLPNPAAKMQAFFIP
jgi:hypothetical protein